MECPILPSSAMDYPLPSNVDAGVECDPVFTAPSGCPRRCGKPSLFSPGFPRSSSHETGQLLSQSLNLPSEGRISGNAFLDLANRVNDRGVIAPPEEVSDLDQGKVQ